MNKLKLRMSQYLGRARLPLLMTVFTASTANAAPGDGINLGRTTVSPALQLNLSYDSNVKHQSPELACATSADPQACAADPSSAILASVVLEIRPSIAFNYKNEDLKLQASIEDLARLYPTSELRTLSYVDDVVASAEGDIFPERRIGLVIRDDFTNHNYIPRGFTTDASRPRTRKYNTLLVEGRYSPGSALDLNLGARWNADVQDALASGGVNSSLPAFKNELGLVARGKWKFFPRTSLLGEVDFNRGGWTQVPACSTYLPTSTSGGSCAGTDYEIDTNAKSTVTQWSATAGISGQFTEAIQANFFLGYGGLYNNTDVSTDNVTGLKGILGQAQVVYTATGTQNVSAGFVRRYGDSAIQDYAISNAFTLGYNGIYFGRMTVGALASFDIREQNSAEVKETSTRIDNVISGLFSVDYQITRWLTAKASFTPSIVLSGADASLSSKDSATLSTYFGFKDYVGLIGLRGIY